tara:strand:- start:449 stop:598 length:150 start_codon:yes stop_codon:yes gene_type:complete
MNEKCTSNNIENDDFILNTKKSDYENLIIRLKEIRVTIALLEKKYFDKP